MATAMVEAGQLTGRELMAHLFRRAGFGATQDELDAALAQGLRGDRRGAAPPRASSRSSTMDLIFRYYVDFHESRKIDSAMSHWVYRMINTQRPLEEKMTLFWHCLFATGNSKVEAPPTMLQQIDTFRRARSRQLPRHPGRALQRPGDDLLAGQPGEHQRRSTTRTTAASCSSCSRWASATTPKTTSRSAPGPSPAGPSRTRSRPPSRTAASSGSSSSARSCTTTARRRSSARRGNFNGEEIIDIIVRQPATAQFLARRLYLFFVADQPDQAAIDELAEVYVRSGHEIRAMLRALFLSDVFRSRRGLLRDGQEPGRLRGRAAAAGRGLHASRSPASTTWRSSAATWARTC